MSIVIGNPVTDDTVRLVFPRITTIEPRHRAEVARLHSNADEKMTIVTKFLHSLKNAYGDDGTSTLCRIYNATGGDLTFVLNHTWESGGNVWQSYNYPQLIHNGQWAGFLHVGAHRTGPSQEAIVYRGTNNNGLSREWMLAWNNTRDIVQNRVYTEAREMNGFASANWDDIGGALDQQFNNHFTSRLGCHSMVQIGAGSSPEFQGYMSLNNHRADNAMAMANDDVSIISQSLDGEHDHDA